MSASPSFSDLDWLAFQYVSEELAPAERAAFEAQLENDVAACEALARATELVLATRTAYAEDAFIKLAQAEGAKYSPARGWWSIVLAGGGLAALILSTHLWRPANPGSASLPQQQQLAIAWSEARASFPTSVVGTDDSDEDAAASLAVSDSFAALEGEGDEGISVPTWLLAAVSAAEGNTEREMDREMELPENPTGEVIP